MKPAFTLIELMLSIAISTLALAAIMSLATTIIHQSNHFWVQTQANSTLDLITTLLNRDLLTTQSYTLNSSSDIILTTTDANSPIHYQIDNHHLRRQNSILNDVNQQLTLTITEIGTSPNRTLTFTINLNTVATRREFVHHASRVITITPRAQL